MNCFVDTSALYAVMDADDRNHGAARKAWEHLLRETWGLVTTNYVLVECAALIQHRLGMDALRAFQEDIYPVLSVEWLSGEIHEAGMTVVLCARRRQLSLVDCTSFDIMRRYGLRQAFAFDPHYGEQGFESVPSGA